MRRVELLGYSVCDETLCAIAQSVCDGIDAGTRQSIVFLNPHSVEVAAKDVGFRLALRSATLVLCDGAGLSLANMILNGRRIHRIYGFQFFVALSAELSKRSQGRVFFLGGDTHLLTTLAARYQREFPGIVAIECYAPPFRREFSDPEVDDMARRVREFRADVLWVGLGSPKQEMILSRLLPMCDAKCGAAVGAVFDFYGERVAYAPEFMRRAGLQWLHRLVLEPRRLWRRTFVSAPAFLWRVIRAKIAKQ